MLIIFSCYLILVFNENMFFVVYVDCVSNVLSVSKSLYYIKHTLLFYISFFSVCFFYLPSIDKEQMMSYSDSPSGHYG